MLEPLNDAAGAALPAAPAADDTPVVVCGVDRGYAIGLAVVLQSALESYRGPGAPRVFVLDGGVTAGQRARLERILARFGAPLTWIPQDPAAFEGLSSVDYISGATFLRLLIPSLLPREVSKAIYLDSDLLVEADLAELWVVDVSGVYLAAAPDPGIASVGAENGLLNHRELGIPPSTRYFNAGVLVLNLERWRADGFGRRVLDYVRANRRFIRWGDQDGLNAVAAGSWRELPERWNRMPARAEPAAPQIVHFLTGCKPWRGYDLGSAGRLWAECLGRSGWMGPLGWAAYRARGGLLSVARRLRRWRGPLG